MCHLILFMPLLGLAVFLIWPLSLAGPLYAVIFVLSVAMYVLIFKAMRLPVVTGSEAMLRSVGTVLRKEADHWQIRVGNETWEAESADSLKIGERVRVTGIDGLRLQVKPDSEAEIVSHNTIMLKH
ncbi:hypothetical protein GCM10011352_18170 [Marinobacterium zhoushanense]|uniref:NfeD-like C-terminal domain-containing protein n=1 Tax=Marinobacterium zhoushanense TaxID=1679163 RepID=A0ABQ1KDA9_9GAMM|nr:NfeD family protein [Marinobacterium zhoushanense]GGB92476.1 hypothetical protein GCM10011352_18170 [Marinobacterium zhoushanense]